jgi:hypothetical protein
LRLSFNGADFSSGADAGQADCKGTVSFQVAPGYGFSDPLVCYEAIGKWNKDAPDGAAVGDLSIQVGFAGGTSRTFTRKVIPDERGLGFECLRLDIASSCSESGLHEMTFSVSMNAESDAFMRLSFLSIDMGYEHSARWRSCDGSSPFAPSKPYGYCHGLNDRGCEDGLTCYDNERWNDEVDDGFCVGPDFQPAEHGERCGGAKDVMCVRGSSCWLFEPRSGAPGVCLSPTDSPDCRQHGPNFCPEGYTCAADGEGACIKSDGTIDSTCVDDSSCKSDFACDPVKHQCRPRRAQLDEPCGGDPGVECVPNLTCDEERHVCRESTGAYRDYCDGTTPPCQEPFECQSNRCLKTNVASHDVCSENEECFPIPLCTNGHCS